MKLNRILAVCLMVSALIITACKKDDDNNNGGGGGTTPETGSMVLEFEHSFDGDHFHLNSTFVTDNDDSLTFTLFKYYVSNIILVNSKNEEYKVPNSYYIIDASKLTNKITLTDIPKGDYKTFKFILGVDSTHNVSGDQTGALDPIHGTFWTWNTGYRFLMAEGTSPQSPTNTFLYHVGGFKGEDNAIRQITIESNSDAAFVKQGATPEVHFMADVSEIFKNPETIDVNTISDIHMPGPAAVLFANNYVDMFTLEHIHN